MKPSDALNANRNEIRRLVAQYPLRNARVFGSALHGQDSEGSDLDILVDPLPGATLLDLGGLQIELERKLGIPVEVLTPGDLPRKFRDHVLREAKPI
ncbi:MAG: nucleotidyltransferase family protein [Desulfuromonadales bacterium]